MCVCEKAPEITACDAMIVASAAKHDQRQEQPGGREQMKERVAAFGLWSTSEA